MASKNSSHQNENFGEEGNRFYADIEQRTEEIERLRGTIVSAKDSTTPGAILEPLALIDIQLDAGMNKSELVQSVHPDQRAREAAELCHQQLAKISADLSLDREVYEAVAGLSADIEREEPQTRRFLEHTLRDFVRAGVDKSDSARERIRKINEELVLLGQEFGRNIREATRYIELDSPSDMDGLPADYIAAHQPDNGSKIRITTDYPDFVPFMSYAKSDHHRRLLYLEYTNRAWPDNERVLREILHKRHELANILGYETWAAFSASNKMIGSATKIAQFVEEIAAITAERSKRDYAQLLERKRKDDPDATLVNDWEKTYLFELVRNETLGFDSQEIRPYLEYGRVKKGILGIAQELFVLEFQKSGDAAWHDAVETYDVFDHGKNIGRFYLDMHPREGKYKHAAMFPVISGVDSHQIPEAALVCNFPNPAATSGPALLEHTDVVTFFHEFGHLMHHILGGKQRYVRFSGVATEWDFVEVPSQVFEEWAFEYGVLERFASHFETGEPIPSEMVERMGKARSFGRGARVRQQMFYAALSLRYHNREPGNGDTTEILKELQNRYSPYKYVDGTHFQASFGHLEGYSALYYTYMWSLVIARDVLDRFCLSGLLDPHVAVDYRRAILDPGGSKDAADLIRDFLGRDYALDAYQRWVEEGE